MRAINASVMRQVNQTLLLNRIRTRPISRAELAEETGLDMPDKGITLLTSLRVPEAFADVYLARTGAPAESVTVTLQEGETSESQWVTLHEFEELLRTGLVPPTLAMVYGTVRAQVIDATGGEI